MRDGRVKPTYKANQVILVTLIGFLLRVTSFNELNRYIKAEEFNNIFPSGNRLPQIDTIRNTMKKMDLDGLRMINKSIINKSIRNKIFANGTLEGNIVAAIDGTQILDSKKKKCEKCLTASRRGVKHYL